MTAHTPRRRSVRFAIVAVVCLLLGAATTVGVAWWLPQWRVGWSRSPPGSLLGADAVSAGWPEFVPQDWPPPQEVTIWSRPGIAEELVASFRSDQLVLGDSNADRRSCTWVRQGWPFYALEYEETRPPGLNRTSMPEMNKWSFVSWKQGFCTQKPFAYSSGGFPGGRYVWYPCMPIFPGFALDTLLYASAWSLLIFTPLPLYRTARRRFRVSRGMCGSCGYDLNASTNRPCPECGA